MRPVSTALTAALLGTLFMAGCGQSANPGSAGPTATSEQSAFPVTVEAGNGKVTIAQQPQRIVSLSATHTETLFAVGAGSQVAAVDSLSNYPQEAPRTDLSGYQPNVEAIVAQKPDLVIVSDDINNVVGELSKLNVPVLHQPAAVRLEDTYEEIAEIGAATGHKAKAEELVTGMKSELARLAADTPRSGLSYYHEVDQTPFAVTSNTYVGQIYSLFGLTNIADKAPNAAGGYPKLSAEFIAKADPDLIFLAAAKCCQQNKEALAKRPGWKNLKAIANDRVIELDDDVASRWGPRVVELAKAVSETVRKAAPNQAASTSATS